MRKFLLTLLAFVFLCPQVQADQLSELKQMVMQMQSQINQLQQENARITARLAEQNVSIEKIESYDIPAQIENRSSEPRTVLGNEFNPSISVLGDVVYRWNDGTPTSHEGDELHDEFIFRSLEMNFSSNVDTWGRADVVVAMENEGGDAETEVHVEEAYLTLLELPFDTQAKVGKFLAYIGKTNRKHLHALPWVDAPKVLDEFIGHEGGSREGVSLNYLLPIDSFYSELTFEAFDDLVSSNGDLAFNTHWKNFFDLNDTTSLELGATYFTEENDSGGSSRTDILGGDVTLTWQPEDQDKKITWLTEVFDREAEEFSGGSVDAFGMFSSLEYWMNPQWAVFGRYDYLEEPEDPDAEIQAYTAGITFAQSEYAYWRLQYTHEDSPEDEDIDTLWLQLSFGIGPHKPHEF